MPNFSIAHDAQQTTSRFQSAAARVDAAAQPQHMRHTNSHMSCRRLRGCLQQHDTPATSTPTADGYMPCQAVLVQHPQHSCAPFQIQSLLINTARTHTSDGSHISRADSHVRIHRGQVQVCPGCQEPGRRVLLKGSASGSKKTAQLSHRARDMVMTRRLIRSQNILCWLTVTRLNSKEASQVSLSSGQATCLHTLPNTNLSGGAGSCNAWV